MSQDFRAPAWRDTPYSYKIIGREYAAEKVGRALVESGNLESFEKETCDEWSRWN